MNLVSLLIAPTVVKYGVGVDANKPLRIAIALVAVALIVAAIYINKRRSSSIAAGGGGTRSETPEQIHPVGV
jgi:K(+)-stimulated pyrophosphate-energized sodium pump